MTTTTRRTLVAGAVALSVSSRAGAQAADGVERLPSLAGEELRGLSLAGGVAWASGAHGTVLPGAAVRRPPGAEALDFRGIQAFSAVSALAMSAGAGEASTLWRTEDAGASWEKIASNHDPKGFWDAIVFSDARNGFILGDPTEGRFTLLRTSTGGASWTRAPAGAVPDMIPGEAAFAASNGSLAVGPKGLVAFVTGGGAQWARAYVSRDGGAKFTAMDAAIPAGSASRGGFACAFDEAGTLWISGGDYREAKAEGVNIARLAPGAKAFQAVAAPAGYMSSIAVLGGTVIATGLAGTVVSRRGAAFTRVSETPFNTVRLMSPTEALLVGPKGAMGRWRA